MYTSYTIAQGEGGYEYFFKGKNATAYYLDLQGNICNAKGGKTNYWLSGEKLHGPEGDTGYMVVEKDGKKLIWGHEDLLPWEAQRVVAYSWKINLQKKLVIQTQLTNRLQLASFLNTRKKMGLVQVIKDEIAYILKARKLYMEVEGTLKKFRTDHH